MGPATTLEALDAEYLKISAQLGEAYVNYCIARDKLKSVRQTRDAIVAQAKLFQSVPPAPTQTAAASGQ